MAAERSSLGGVLFIRYTTMPGTCSRQLSILYSQVMLENNNHGLCNNIVNAVIDATLFYDKRGCYLHNAVLHFVQRKMERNEWRKPIAPSHERAADTPKRTNYCAKPFSS